ncbi:MAG: substrate-binding domain-containing protein [Arcobacteraceae bacterium]|nr:substrate-binding domain-containing protein [Arcobacteraceae bacterium]
MFAVFFSPSETQAMENTKVFGKEQAKKKLVYIVSDIRIPFWDIMARGIKNAANSKGYRIDVYSADNIKKTELENTAKAIRDKVSGIIISPINSSSAVTILKLAKKAGIPVVISDIGTYGGEYVSYISSNNKEGAYKTGKVLAKKMKELGWDKDGSVGIVAIPQKRVNGKVRTAGFMKAMNEAGIKGIWIREQVTFSYQETYDFSKELIQMNPNLRALWLQGSNRYQGALDAIKDAGKKDDILLICFDAEPIFLDIISKGILLGAAMQQPYLMGEESVNALDKHLKGKKVEKNLQLPILFISKENMEEMLPIIKRNTLGIEIK